MYKDKDKQREANKKAQAKFKAKGITQGITSEGISEQGITEAIEDMAHDFCGKPRPKRGKDIKCFEDLPADVQLGILHMSRGEDGKTDQTIKANRTAIAVNYQHLFPSRFHSTSVECVYVKEQRQREGEGVT